LARSDHQRQEGISVALTISPQRGTQLARAAESAALTSRLSGANSPQCRITDPAIRCACEMEEP